MVKRFRPDQLQVRYPIAQAPTTGIVAIAMIVRDPSHATPTDVGLKGGGGGAVMDMEKGYCVGGKQVCKYIQYVL